MDLQGSSVDPQQIETRFCEENTTNPTQSSPRNSMEYASLPTSDLEPDAVPSSPEASHAAGVYGDAMPHLPRVPFEGPTAPPLAELPPESTRTDPRDSEHGSRNHQDTRTHSPVGGQRASQQRETYCPLSKSGQPSREPENQPEGAHANPPSIAPVQEVSMKGDMPVSVKFDAVIICHDDDAREVNQLKDKLNNLVLFDNKMASVAVEDDGPDLGKGEVAYFEDSKREFVIPIFLEKKYKLKYLKPSIKAIKGIEYIDCQWTEKVAERFRKNLNIARQKRQENLAAKMADMTVT